MTAVHRDRTWLRGFLRLGQRAGQAVRKHDVERQEDTVLRALQLLDEQPGVVLADEVGMGKTYEALGVLAARLHQRPEARALILTPGADLNIKWCKDLAGFCDPGRPMYAGFEGKFGAADSLAELVEMLRVHPIVIAPVTIFIGGRGHSDLAYLLSLWGDARKMAGNQLAAIFRRYRDGKLEHVQASNERFLGAFDHAAIAPHIAAVMRAHKASDDSLDAMWAERSYDAFANKEAVDRALADLRFRLIGALLPALDLLVVDEAHKLKNSDSVRATGVRTAFGQRFEKALFLTATPFQLTVRELRAVFELFDLARSAPPEHGLLVQADELLGHVDEYTQAYAQLERVWSAVDPLVAQDFAAWFERDQTLASDPEDPSLRSIVSAARRLVTIKRDRIEPGFRRWMIRSLREDKRVYRRSTRTRLPARGGAGVPFLLYERFISELFRSGNQTHKAAVQINMVSSYAAAREGALLADPTRKLEGDAERYRRLLKDVVGELRNQDGGHPKVDHVVRDSLAAALKGEKTLIFCARVQTLMELKRQIENAWDQELLTRWRRAYPDATLEDIFEHTVGGKRVDGHHSRLRDRFTASDNPLHLALRERYVSTLLGGWEPTAEDLEEVVARANTILAWQRLSPTHSKSFDWALAKRCVEQAAALILRARGRVEDVDDDDLAHLTDERFVLLGFDLHRDDVEAYAGGNATATWRLDADDARLILGREHLWATLTSALHGLPPDLRVRTTERLASYLIKRHVPFLPEVVAFARAQGLDPERLDGRALLAVIDRFWTHPDGRPWCELLRRFVIYAGTLDLERHRDVLDDALTAGDLVRHTVDAESREKLREAFNTPLFPMVLVANEVMQEGLDLHHHCRRVVHHDLAWNPAQLEQRVGRVDRLGSLVQRLRESAPETKLDVLLPLVANTIDERLERTVRLRERWLEFLLGAAPRIEEYGLADDPPPPLPPAFANALKVDLGPAKGAT